MFYRTVSAARAILLAGSAAIVAIPAQAYAQEQVAGEANAQADEADPAETIGDIVVTARRRNEILQDVPIAVTAYSGAALEAEGALDITDIGDTTPNVTLEASRATNSTLTAFIRGVGQQDPVAGFEQGVGIYLDDVYLNRPQAAVLDIYDVERIEVLRGPQGTLYGRNTVGGAVKYVTRRLPSDAELRFRANLGTDEQADLVVSGSSPVGNGVFRLGASAARLSRGGFGKNLTTDEENYNKDVWAGRVSAEVNNEDNIFFRLSGDYIRDTSNPRGGHRLVTSHFTNTPVLDDVFDTQGGLEEPKQKVEGYGLSLFGEIKASETLTLRSITAWRKDDSSTPIDFDALPATDVDVPGRYNNKQISQELQLLVNAGKFNGLIGAYYLDADASTPFDVRLPGTLTAFTDAAMHTLTYAVFGDFTYDISDQFSISAGGRYTWDKREADILRQNYLFGGSPEFGGTGSKLGKPSTDFSGSETFKKFTPRVSASFKPTPDHHIYASYSKGFKGGGFDPRGVGANAPDLDGDGIKSDAEVADFLSFDPETVDSYELGYKGSLLDNRLNVAIAAFHANYKDVQIPGSVACDVPVGTVLVRTFCGVVSNAGKARFQGLEFEGNARVAESLMNTGDRLRLAATVGYINADYKEYITNIASTPTDVAEFRKVQNTPKWTTSGTLNYTTPLGGGDLNFNTTVSYRSKTVQFEIPNPYIDQKGYSLWDASLVYTRADGRWSVGLHGKNLLDKEYKTSGYTFMAANATTGELLHSTGTTAVCGKTVPAGNLIPALGCEGVLSAFYGNPRQVFLSLGYKL